MPSGTRDAELRVKRKSARTKRSNFQVHPAGYGFWCMGYLFESTSVFPEESFWKWVPGLPQSFRGLHPLGHASTTIYSV